MTRGKNEPRVSPEPAQQEDPTIHLQDAIVTAHTVFQGGYRLLSLRADRIAPEVRPGQFVHVQIPRLGECLLRRPFSVYQADNDELRVLYKNIGCGTDAMTRLAAGDAVSLIGPLGRPFPAHQPGAVPVLVAGGYGMAALYLVARNQPTTGLAFFGGRSAEDILCVEEFEAMGWEVRVTTEDGSRGRKGRITVALDAWLDASPEGSKPPEFFCCGPNPMLRAVSDRAQAGEWRAWISMDRTMCCGVGACLTCVQKVVDTSGGDWVWSRVCREGPVYECREIVWDD